MTHWSDFGGRGRDVTIVYPRWWPPGLAALWGVRPGRAALAYGGGVALFGFLLMMAWPVLSSAADVPILLVFAALWALAFGYCLLQFVRILPDVAGRSVVEGRVIHRRLVKGINPLAGEGPTIPDAWWLAVDDGRSDTAPAYKVGAGTFAAVQKHDIVRLTLGLRHGHVFAIDVLASSAEQAARADATPGAASGPASPGAAPVPAGPPAGAPDRGEPDAPATAAEVYRILQREVRGITGPTRTTGIGSITTWTYQLGAADTETLRVHVSNGLIGVQTIFGTASRGYPRAKKISQVGDVAWRFGDLLVARRGKLTVGIEPAPGLRLPAGNVDELARAILDGRALPPTR